ncbi:hypothetical protein V2J09_018017 [Rumex salicifolius]
MRLSKTKVSDYSKKIESIVSKLAVPLDETHVEESRQKFEERSLVSSSASGLRKRVVPTSSIEDRTRDNTVDPSTPIKLDSAAQAHIEKHRQLQEDLTDG